MYAYVFHNIMKLSHNLFQISVLYFICELETGKMRDLKHILKLLGFKVRIKEKKVSRKENKRKKNDKMR